jgi:hypothetical protein
MNEKRFDIPKNIAEGLSELTEAQLEVQQGVLALHRSAIDIVARDTNSAPKELAVGDSLITASTVPIEHNGTKFQARAFASKLARSPFGEESIVSGIRIYSPDAKFKELTTYDSGVLLFGTDTGDEDLSADLSFAQKILKELDTVVTDKQYTATLEKRRKQRRREDAIKKTGKSAIALVAASAAAFGLYKVATDYIIPGAPERFDKKEYAIPGGNILRVGETEHPAFSKYLHDNKSLGRNKVPRINHPDKSGNRGGNVHPYDGTMDTSDGLREMIITSSKPGKNCQAITVHSMDLDARATIWTDFVNTEGKSRANELDASLLDGKLRLCWNGQELSNKDDPRIVFQVKNP